MKRKKSKASRKNELRRGPDVDQQATEGGISKSDEFAPEEFAGFGEFGEDPEWRGGSIGPQHVSAKKEPEKPCD